MYQEQNSNCVSLRSIYYYTNKLNTRCNEKSYCPRNLGFRMASLHPTIKLVKQERAKEDVKVLGV